jgi:hypothetical protein
VNLGKSIGIIDDQAFFSCTALTAIVIPDSVTILGPNSFRNCESMKSVSLGKSTETIGTWAFGYCYELCEIVVPDLVGSIQEYSFFECISLETVVLGKSIASIDGYAFCYCHSLSGIVIPDSVTIVRTFAFFNCWSLSFLVFGESIAYLDTLSFSNCTSLTSLTLPSTLVALGNYAFRECTSLKKLTFTGLVAPEGSMNVFDKCGSLAEVGVPRGYEDQTFFGFPVLKDEENVVVEANRRETVALGFLLCCAGTACLEMIITYFKDKRSFMCCRRRRVELASCSSIDSDLQTTLIE